MSRFSKASGPVGIIPARIVLVGVIPAGILLCGCMIAHHAHATPHHPPQTRTNPARPNPVRTRAAQPSAGRPSVARPRAIEPSAVQPNPTRPTAARATTAAPRTHATTRAVPPPQADSTLPRPEAIEVRANRGSYTVPTTDLWGKSGVALKDVPHSLSVITQERMQDSNMLTMTDAMRQVNGIHVLPGSSANSNFYSRGYQLTTSLDGTPNAAGTLNNATFDLSMYERIEVLRGSAGLLQGAGGAGGVVNEVTKKPGHDFALGGAASVGSFDNYRADIDLSTPLNRSGTLRFRTADLFEDNRYFYQYSHSRKWQAYGALEWDITPTTTFLVSHAAQQQDITAPYFGLPVTTDRTLWYGGRSANPSQPWGYSNYMTRQTAVSLSQKIGRNWTLTARGTFYDQSYDMLYNEPWTTIGAKSGLLTYEDQGISAQKGTNSSRSADIYATGAFRLFHHTHHLLAGFNYNSYDQYVAYPDITGSGVYDNISIRNTAAIPAPAAGSVSYAASSGGAEGRDDAAYQWGFYGQLRLEPVRGLSVVLGGRVSRFYEHARDTSPSPRGAWATRSDIHAQLTPYLGSVYQITPHLSWYASYASIFTPSVGDMRYRGGGLAPQLGNQVETGFKGEYFHGRLNVSTALFRMESVNQPLSDPEHVGFYITTGPIRRQGWEAQMDGEILPNLSVSIGYTYLDTKLSNPSSADFGGAYSPHHMFKSWVHYTLPAGRLKGLSLGAGIDASSNLHGGYPTTVQGGYMTIDSVIGYVINRHLRLQLNANNLTNRYYYERASGVWQFNFPAAPRNFMATLRATY
ncbi:TonB-dependent siderophore receptor [Novacetimonas hansenii]|uniref:TonB-dependent siderophore receptor n=1 Tax=Novacetimonas hansenii TaxID=436 RepID=UPI000798229A|nr:TonB-dependent siderophore receptor [Novacetimonas hansenii]WEQ57757.1 TonB-dependent siderophore receptor [Novacetimonas hansenii]CUW46329.1 Fe(3)-pyochelin receptor precursor [Novacetimonas hansenii]